MSNDEHNDRVYVTSIILKSLCLKYGFRFINHFRINASSLFYDNKHVKDNKVSTFLHFYYYDIRSSLFDFKARSSRLYEEILMDLGHFSGQMISKSLNGYW